MKKILFVITKANWGGAQKYVFDLATNLPKDQFNVSVAYGQPGLLAQKLAESHIQTHVLMSMQRDVAFGADVRACVELYRLFKKIGPNVVHLNSSKAGGVGALAARLAGVPTIVFTTHGWPFRERRNVLMRAALWLASWLTALLATRVICVSDYDLRQARAMPLAGRKAVRIYNGIAPMQFGSGDVIRRAFPAGVFITGTIGELTHNKNHIALINKARADRAMHVAIVGEGELRDFLQNKINGYGLQDRVKLLGHVPASEALKGFDRFALPSLKEGLPYVLLEAKMAGLSIDAKPVGGVPEILNGKIDDFTLERMVAQTAALY